jgi:hypothetical protein
MKFALKIRGKSPFFAVLNSGEELGLYRLRKLGEKSKFQLGKSDPGPQNPTEPNGLGGLTRDGHRTQWVRWDWVGFGGPFWVRWG